MHVCMQKVGVPYLIFMHIVVVKIRTATGRIALGGLKMIFDYICC